MNASLEKELAGLTPKQKAEVIDFLLPDVIGSEHDEIPADVLTEQNGATINTKLPHLAPLHFATLTKSGSAKNEFRTHCHGRRQSRHRRSA